MWLTGFLQVPFDINPAVGYPLRFAELLLGGAILAFGIACEVRCDSLMLAGEGFPLAIAKFLKKDFGKVKIFSDTSLVTALWCGCSRPGSGGWTVYSFPGPSVRPGLPLRLSRLLSGLLTA